MDLEKENRTLRRLLCFKIAGSKGYYDDGELQDNTEKPFIDFKRDSANEIDKKLIRRSLNKIKRISEETQKDDHA